MVGRHSYHSRHGGCAAIRVFPPVMPAVNLTTLREELASKGIKYCVGSFVDIHGVPKGKVVPISHFEQFAAGSEMYTGYALDGLGQAPDDDEISSMPDLDRGLALPWQPEVM